MTMAQYWSSGLSPLPSAGTKGAVAPSGEIRTSWSKGLDKKRLSARKKARLTISTATTQGIMSRWRRRFCTMTRPERRAVKNTHRSIEPSCPPQMAEILYRMGSERLLLLATWEVAKSSASMR
jgi:hypothetical protein